MNHSTCSREPEMAWRTRPRPLCYNFGDALCGLISLGIRDKVWKTAVPRTRWHGGPDDISDQPTKTSVFVGKAMNNWENPPTGPALVQFVWCILWIGTIVFEFGLFCFCFVSQFLWNTNAKIGHVVTKPRFLNTNLYFWPLSVKWWC